nr:immunoglobulin light chain junction region [Macaca mulatta]MOW18484.1 immunoglobulin light chain junction region [Macaca mulatta]
DYYCGSYSGSNTFLF